MNRIWIHIISFIQLILIFGRPVIINLFDGFFHFQLPNKMHHFMLWILVEFFTK